MIGFSFTSEPRELTYEVLNWGSEKTKVIYLFSFWFVIFVFVKIVCINFRKTKCFSISKCRLKYFTTIGAFIKIVVFPGRICGIFWASSFKYGTLSFFCTSLYPNLKTTAYIAMNRIETICCTKVVTSLFCVDIIVAISNQNYRWHFNYQRHCITSTCYLGATRVLTCQGSFCSLWIKIDELWLQKLSIHTMLKSSYCDLDAKFTFPANHISIHSIATDLTFRKLWGDSCKSSRVETVTRKPEKKCVKTYDLM